MNHTVKRLNEQLENREFSSATQIMYGFIYDNFCDVFIENSKKLLEGSDEERRSGESGNLTSIMKRLIR
jgi:valyl-tRNA synthetase